MSRYRDTETGDTPMNPYGSVRNRNRYTNSSEFMSSDSQLYDANDDNEIYPDDEAEYDNYDESESTEPVVIGLRGSFGDTEDLSIGGDPSDEPAEAAWVDEKGITPQIRLGDKLYYLNKFNWNWLNREASAGDNNELLRANIRSPRDLQMYIVDKYPGLRYVNRDMNRGEYPYNESGLLPPLNSRYSRENPTPDRTARPINQIRDYDMHSGRESNYDDYEDYDDYEESAEYTSRRPKRAYSARV